MTHPISSKSAIRKALEPYCGCSRIILVPTMGALHQGHKTLLDEGRKIAGADGILVASIFLNPIQFNNVSDFKTYPRTLEQDLALCDAAGVDFVFTPNPDEMYSSDKSISIEETMLSGELCGASRPGHFSGVCTVVGKLFNIIQPTDALFGKKDFQQLAILRRMVRDLDFPITVHGVEIVREPSGLAYSSRNARLTEEQVSAAPILYKTLLTSKDSYRSGKGFDSIKAEAEKAISAVPGTVIDYIEIVHAETMQPLLSGDHESPALMAVAVAFGDVRLIDNIEL